MPAAAETYSLGAPVEIGKIEKELKKLWQEGEGAMTRASLMNLAVYSEEAGSLNKNTQLMAKIAENHACRAIVIEADCRSEENRVDAWISAHCHVSRTGKKQVCSEQISFLLKGGCTTQLPSIILSNLDSDLPFYLWWQGELHDPMDAQLWEWVDRFIYDSHDWKDFPAQMALVETAHREAKQRLVLCDLNWTRLDHVRIIDWPRSVRCALILHLRSGRLRFYLPVGSEHSWIGSLRKRARLRSCGLPGRPGAPWKLNCVSAKANQFTKSR